MTTGTGLGTAADAGRLHRTWGCSWSSKDTAGLGPNALADSGLGAVVGAAVAAAGTGVAAALPSADHGIGGAFIGGPMGISPVTGTGRTGLGVSEMVGEVVATTCIYRLMVEGIGAGAAVALAATSGISGLGL